MFFIVFLLLILVIPTVAIYTLQQHALMEWKRDCERVNANNQRYKNLAADPLPSKPEFKQGAYLVAPAVAVVYTLFECFTVIPAGHIGVQVTFGNVHQQTLTEGAHMVNPLSYVRNVEVRLVTTKLKEASASTKDLQQVHTDIVLNYRLDGAKAAHIYKEFGLDLEEKVILPAMNESFKAVTARYTSEELITKRDTVSAQIREELGGKLGKFSVSVNDISLVNFAFSADYQKAIEAKVIATQNKLKAEQDLARIEVEAKQVIARAEGEAKSIQIQTQAINSQGGASYVQLQAIRKWDGKLPETILGGGTVPFVNINK